MPVYSWKGLDARGVVLNGTQFARSQELLCAHLLERHIGLLEARVSFSAPRISLTDQQQFFSHLASLIQSHIPVHSALIIIAAAVKKPCFKAILEDVAILVSHGLPLSEALQFHGLSDELTRAVIAVSEKTGALGPALQALADHRAFINTLRKKIRASVFGPCLTLVFFFISMLGIFLLVIPQLESYFLSYNAPLPKTTAAILAVSRFLRSNQALWLLGCILLAMALISKGARTERGRQMLDKLAFIIPGSRSWMRLVYQARVLKTVGMLLEQGVSLSQALDVCIQTVVQGEVLQAVKGMKSRIEGGAALSVAWRASLLSAPEIEAFLNMGESSGDLGAMMTAAGDNSLSKIYDSLQLVVTLVQPLLLFLLGILVAGLLVAVYMPLLTLSELLV